jgi:hypothetical protein
VLKIDYHRRPVIEYHRRPVTQAGNDNLFSPLVFEPALKIPIFTADISPPAHKEAVKMGEEINSWKVSFVV